jgi:hypothetical protein
MKIRIETYPELEGCVQAFDGGTFNVLFVVGDHGQGKTTLVRKVLGKKAEWIEGGSVSAFRLYQDLYRCKDRDFVLDDCDQLWTDRTTIRLMKCLCQTEKTKTVGWHTHNTYLDQANIPTQFETRSRIVIIANRWHTISPHVESLEDWGLMVLFQPPAEEVLREGRKWFKDREILRFMEENLGYIESLSMRARVVAKSVKDAGVRLWWEALRRALGIDISDEERIRVFHDRTGLSRTTCPQLKEWLTADRKRPGGGTGPSPEEAA